MLLKEYPSSSKIISTLPVVAGVIMVSYGESKITYTLLFSMLSNVAFSFRNVAGKKVMVSSFQDPTILFYGINIIGTIALIPIILFSQENTSVFGDINLWSSGLFHFLYNWCSFLLLSRLHVLSHALGNVMKRAFIITVGIVLYHADVNVPTILGIIFCIGGSLLYNYVGNAVKSNNLSSRLSLFNNLFSLASILSVLLLFSASSSSSASGGFANNYLSTSSFLSPTSNKLVLSELPKDNNHFMIIWTRLEQQIPVRIEKCVESILYHHKDALITVYASYIETQEPLKALVAEYPFQIQIKPIDVQKILRDTPLEYWGRNHREWKWRSLTKFDFHVVDALRYALLFKYGGVAIDADMVLLNPVTQQFNFITDYFGDLTTKVMKFEKGHPFLTTCMEKFATNYEPTVKSAHGPVVVKNVYNSYCKQQSTNSTILSSSTEVCKNVKPLILLNTAHFNVEEYYDFVAFDSSQHIELLDELKDSVAVDINYFNTANLTISKDTFMDVILSKYSVLSFDDNYRNPFNLNLLMKFGTYIYSTINFGDEVQSIANIQYLPRIDYFLERDSLMNYTSLPNITIIANGWYTWNGNWSVPPNIHPIFVAFHGSDRFPYNATKEYMIKMGPIGCRDLFTLEKFRQIGVNAYFSGCITTTLQNTRWDHPKENIIYITDATLNHLLPYSGVPGHQLVNKTHVTWSRYRHKYNYKMDLACRTLDLYSVAKLVITTRIHCALPSLAFGTPVIFTKPNKKFFEPLTNGMDPRWPGLLDLFYQYTINTTMEEAKSYPYANPPKNRNHDWMRKNVWSHLQRSPYIKESGRMFGVFKNVPAYL